MSKADSLPSTPAAGLNRRGLLAAVGGVVTTTVLPRPTAAAAAGRVHSPELLEFRRMVAAGELVDGVFKAKPPQMTDAAYSQALHRWARLFCRRGQIERAILTRPLGSWTQAIELAEVARQGDRHAHDALVDAVLSAAKGGEHA